MSSHLPTHAFVSLRLEFVRQLSMLGMIMLLATPLFFLIGYYMFFDDTVPFTQGAITVNDANGKPVSQVRGGDFIFPARNFCDVRAVRFESVKRLVRSRDGATYILSESAIGTLKPGGPCYVATNIIHIPPNFPPDKYRYSIVIEYSNNPLHRAILEVRSNEFEIQ